MTFTSFGMPTHTFHAFQPYQIFVRGNEISSNLSKSMADWEVFPGDKILFMETLHPGTEGQELETGFANTALHESFKPPRIPVVNEQMVAVAAVPECMQVNNNYV